MQCAAGVLRAEGCSDAEVSVVFIDSRRSRMLNRRFLRHDYVTDVLSFPLGMGETPEGEVYVNLDRARQQARSYGVSFSNEVGRLVIHGVLHLLGYDDTTSAAQRRMKLKEDRYVEEWCER